jgi:hypothetical protein
VGFAAGAGAGAGLPAVQQDTNPPHTIAVYHGAPSAVDCDEKERLVSKLKRTLWVRNPFFIQPQDWPHCCSLTAAALRELVHSGDQYHLEGINADNFWPTFCP